MVDLNGRSREQRSLRSFVEVMERVGISEGEIEKLVLATEPKPITLDEASQKYYIPTPTLHAWVRRGHLTVLGRQKNPRTRRWIVLDENEVIEKVVVATESKTILISEAARKYDVLEGTLRSWVKRGHLQIVGYQRSFITRPRMLIDENELRERIGK